MTLPDHLIICEMEDASGEDAFLQAPRAGEERKPVRAQLSIECLEVRVACLVGLVFSDIERVLFPLSF